MYRQTPLILRVLRPCPTGYRLLAVPSTPRSVERPDHMTTGELYVLIGCALAAGYAIGTMLITLAPT